MNLEVDKEDVKNLEVVYSGHDCMASVEDFLTAEWNRASLMITVAYEIRYNFAITGAMRRPWSQEAPMRSNFEVSGP